MAHVNDNYLKLKAGYLFPEIARRVSSFCEQNPNANVIRLGIGDVTEPLPPAIVEAMHKAIDEMASKGILWHEAEGEFEKLFMIRVLREQKGNLLRTAEVMGLHRNTVAKKVQAHGIRPETYRKRDAG